MNRLVRARQFHECWAAIERRFYERWLHGILWLMAGGVGLATAFGLLRDAFLVGRLGAAAMVLGIGLGVLRALGLASLLQRAPDAFLRLVGGDRCPLPQRSRPYRLYFGLMESGFVLVECLVLLGLLGLSTTAAALPIGKFHCVPVCVLLIVYGFFAVTFGGKNAVTALAWARWLRPRLERFLEWRCADWLIATGEWEATWVGLLRPRLSPLQRARHASATMFWQGVLIFAVIVAWVLGLTFLAIALAR
ncbi:MAG: hypothetical protein SLRJCFUN_000009 [Candidatus Fervidibacter sp.]